MSVKLKFGFFAPYWTNYARMLMDGVVRYLQTNESIELRGYRYLENIEKHSDHPPWTNEVHGVIINAGNSPEMLRWLKRGRVPVVSATGDFRGTGIPSLSTDSRLIARMALDHFESLGHRHVAFVSQSSYAVSQSRQTAFEREAASYDMKTSSIEVTKPLEELFGKEESWEGTENLTKFLQSSRKPVGLLAMNDRVGTWVTRCAIELGLNIPEQVAILGVGDSDLSRLCVPPISTIQLNTEEIGYRAAHRLHQMILGEPTSKRDLDLAPVRVIPRQSTVGLPKQAVSDVDLALQFIHERACAGIRTKDVANEVHISLRALELEFKKTLGRTMGSIIQEVRLDRAKHLLETTDLSTQRIATLVGFTHYSCLNRMTARMLGMTPIEYRKQARRQK